MTVTVDKKANENKLILKEQKSLIRDYLFAFFRKGFLDGLIQIIIRNIPLAVQGFNMLICIGLLMFQR